MKKLAIGILALSTLLEIVACGGDSTSPPPNRRPAISTGPTATPSAILDSQMSGVAVTATDADGDQLTYEWSATGGTITGDGATVTYDPDTVVTQTVHRVDVVVSDGNDGSVSGFVNVTVSPTPAENVPPEITAGPTADPTTILDRETSGISITATDPDGDDGTLTYTWSAANGTISGEGNSVTYIPNPVTATVVHKVNVVVSDVRDGSVSGQADVIVNPSPPVVVNNGELTEWTATLTTMSSADPPVYEKLTLGFGQDGASLSGEDFYDVQADVFVDTTGTVDGFGNVMLTSTATQGTQVRAVITFSGKIEGPPTSQTISGTFVASGGAVANPPQNGTFTMTHN